MRLSCIICESILIALCVCGAVYAFTGFDLLGFLCFNNVTVCRCALSAGGVAALFTLYALIVFRPFRGLK